MMPAPALVHIAVDESGRLAAPTPYFALAGVITNNPDRLKNLIRRVAFHSGKRLQRARHTPGEFKWHNVSQRFRQDVLNRLALTDVEIVTLVVRKQGRQIDDTPENNAVLVCALLQLCWNKYPNVALLLDKHFTSPAQVAMVNTLIYRQWPADGILSVQHVDSQHAPIVQLADFVAGSVYSWYATGEGIFRILVGKTIADRLADWVEIKGEWAENRQQKTEPPN